MEYKKLFIVGPTRSGSHFLRQVFYANPNTVSNKGESSIVRDIVGTIVNSRLPWRRNFNHVISQYDSFRGLPQWDISKDKLIAFIKKAELKKGSKKDQAYTVARLCFDDYYYSHGGDGEKVLVEKTPSHIEFSEGILEYFPESKILFLVRDSRSVIASLKVLSQKGVGWAKKDLKHQISFWKKPISLGLSILKNDAYTGRVLLMKYEQLMENFESSINKAYDFAGCTISDYQMNDVLGMVKKNYSKDKWKSILNPKEIHTINSETGQLMEQLGYVID